MTDCVSPFTNLVAHKGVVEQGTIRTGDPVTAKIDHQRRSKIANNHTATHLLHWALAEVLGEHVKQAGSVVESERLRFDFHHHKPIAVDEIRSIEAKVNQKIRQNIEVDIYEISLEEAQARKDIKTLFSDRYGERVRVIDILESKELCGGTHTTRTGNIGYFRIVKEGSISAGIRRIEAVTGEEAERFALQPEDALSSLAQLLKSPPALAKEKIEKLLEENKNLSQLAKAASTMRLQQEVERLLKKIELVGNAPLLVAVVPFNAGEVKELSDLVLEKHPSLILLLATSSGERCSLLARVSPDNISKGIRADQWIQTVAPLIGGKGGGKADSAQAGGTQFPSSEQLLHASKEWLSKLF